MEGLVVARAVWLLGFSVRLVQRVWNHRDGGEALLGRGQFQIDEFILRAVIAGGAAERKLRRQEGVTVAIRILHGLRAHHAAWQCRQRANALGRIVAAIERALQHVDLFKIQRRGVHGPHPVDGHLQQQAAIAREELVVAAVRPRQIVAPREEVGGNIRPEVIQDLAELLVRAFAPGVEIAHVQGIQIHRVVSGAEELLHAGAIGVLDPLLELRVAGVRRHLVPYRLPHQNQADGLHQIDVGVAHLHLVPRQRREGGVHMSLQFRAHLGRELCAVVQQQRTERLRGELDRVGVLDFRMSHLPEHFTVSRRMLVHVLLFEEEAQHSLGAFDIVIEREAGQRAVGDVAHGRRGVLLHACVEADDLRAHSIRQFIHTGPVRGRQRGSAERKQQQAFHTAMIIHGSPLHRSPLQSD